MIWQRSQYIAASIVVTSIWLFPMCYQSREIPQIQFHGNSRKTLRTIESREIPQIQFSRKLPQNITNKRIQRNSPDSVSRQFPQNTTNDRIQRNSPDFSHFCIMSTDLSGPVALVIGSSCCKDGMPEIDILLHAIKAARARHGLSRNSIAIAPPSPPISC
jgi:hypothetical protein